MPASDLKLKVIIEAVDAGFAAKVDAASARTQKFGAAATGAAIGMAAFGGATLLAIRQVTGAAMQLERANAAFSQMLGGMDKAKDFTASLRAFAAQTPFQFKDLTTLSQKVLAFGFSAKEVVPMLRDLGDAAGALGAGPETLGRIVVAFGQIKAKRKISMEEVLQLAEAGIPIFDILRDKLHLTQAQMGDIGRAGIPAEKALAAIREGLREKFGGGMAKQMETTAGAISNLEDALFDAAATTGASLTPAMKDLSKWLSQVIPKLSEAAATPLGQGLIKVAAGAGVLSIALAPLVALLPGLVEGGRVLRGIGGGILPKAKATQTGEDIAAGIVAGGTSMGAWATIGGLIAAGLVVAAGAIYLEQQKAEKAMGDVGAATLGGGAWMPEPKGVRIDPAKAAAQGWVPAPGPHGEPGWNIPEGRIPRTPEDLRAVGEIPYTGGFKPFGWTARGQFRTSLEEMQSHAAPLPEPEERKAARAAAAKAEADKAAATAQLEQNKQNQEAWDKYIAALTRSAEVCALFDEGSEATASAQAELHDALFSYAEVLEAAGKAEEAGQARLEAMRMERENRDRAKAAAEEHDTQAKEGWAGYLKYLEQEVQSAQAGGNPAYLAAAQGALSTGYQQYAAAQLSQGDVLGARASYLSAQSASQAGTKAFPFTTEWGQATQGNILRGAAGVVKPIINVYIGGERIHEVVRVEVAKMAREGGLVPIYQ